MVFQKPNPFPMSIYDNIAYGPRTHGIRSKARLDDVVEKALRDAAIDESEHTIETICLKLLLRQQAVASDLRQISAAMKMITDMERIGDHCTNIAEWVEFSVTGIHRDCQ